VGSLLVGLSFAKSLAAVWNVPLVPVHHLAGHIESLALQHGPLPLPAIRPVVSGGHTSLYEIRTAGHYDILGRTRDDAAGEAYDKVANCSARLSGRPRHRPPRPRRQRSRDPVPVARMTHPEPQRAAAEGPVGLQLQRLETSVLRHVKAQGR